MTVPAVHGDCKKTVHTDLIFSLLLFLLHNKHDCIFTKILVMQSPHPPTPTPQYGDDRLIDCTINHPSPDDPQAELVRHFLIEPTPKGVRLRGCSNEPVFGKCLNALFQCITACLFS